MTSPAITKLSLLDNAILIPEFILRQKNNVHKMNRLEKRNAIEVTIIQTLSSKKLNANQEMKRQVLPELMYKHWHEFNLEYSVDRVTDIWIKLY